MALQPGPEGNGSVHCSSIWDIVPGRRNRKAKVPSYYQFWNISGARQPGAGSVKGARAGELREAVAPGSPLKLIGQSRKSSFSFK